MRRLASLAVAALAAAALAFPAAALPAEACPKTTLADIEDEVMCPICGTPLALATEAPQAQRQRAYIERQVAACRSKDEIKRSLVAQFGQSVLALPGDDGERDLGDVLVYLIPGIGILLALGGIALALLRWRSRGRGPDAARRARRPRPAAASADAGRLDSDMERYDL